MGTKFRYISDDALDAAKAAINCEKCSSPEPAYIVEAVFQDGSDDPDELDFERALCVNCIRTIPLRNLIPIFPELQIQAAVNRHFPREPSVEKTVSRGPLISVTRSEGRPKSSCFCRITTARLAVGMSPNISAPKPKKDLISRNTNAGTKMNFLLNLSCRTFTR